MIQFTPPSPSKSKDKEKDKEFEEMIQELKDAYYNSGSQEGGHCFRFIAVRAPASSIAGFLVEMQKPIEALQKAKEEVKGLGLIDRLFIPKVTGSVGPKAEEMIINRTPPSGK